MEKTFEPRKGTISHGDRYESIITANLSLNLSTNQEIKNFYISSNNSQFKLFDDVVVEIENVDGIRETVAIQLKHFENGRKKFVRLESLGFGVNGEKGKLNLKAYADLNPAEKLCNRLVLFTNKQFAPNCDQIEKLQFCLKDGSEFFLEVKIIKIDNPDKILNTKGGSCYKFDILSEIDRDGEKNTIFEKFTSFFTKFYLYTNQLQAQDMEDYIKDNFQEKFNCSEKDSENYINFVCQWSISDRKKNHLSKIFVGKAITFLLLDVQPICQSCHINEKMKLFQECVSKFDITILTNDSDRIRKIWSDTELPQNETKMISHWIQNYQLVKKSQYTLDFIDDVVKSKVLWLLNKCPLIIKEHLSFWNIVKIFGLRNIVLILTEQDEKLPEGKIFRYLSDLRNEDDDIYKKVVTTFTVSLQGREPVTLDVLNKIDSIVSVNELLKMTDKPLAVGGEKEQLPSTYIERRISKYVINEKIVEDFPWESVTKITEHYVQDSEIYNDLDDSVNVICANPGMGKTTLTKNLKNNMSSKFWTIVLEPRTIRVFLHQENFVNNIIKTTTKENSFERKLLEFFSKNRRLVFIWDAIDELSDKDLKIVIDVIQKLSLDGFSQWVTSRNHLKELLEKSFRTIAKNIELFNSDQQKAYIENNLKEKYTENVRDIFMSLRNYYNEDIFGSPLHIYMLTTIFNEDSKKYTDLLNNFFSVVHLYKYFVDEKFKIYSKDKLQMPQHNVKISMVLKTFQDSYEEKCGKCAIMTFFEDKFNFENDCDNFAKEIESEGDLPGFISRTNQNEIVFIHPSFAEYFAALFLYRRSEYIHELKDVIFCTRYRNIRFMFDCLMAEDSPLHIAVLHQKLPEKIFYVEDKFGRTPLHLLCSWGSEYFLLVRQRLCHDICEIEETYVTEKESQAYDEMISRLLQVFKYNQKDKLFNLDPLSYADRSRCLFAIMCMSKEAKINFDHLTMYNDIPTIVYYAVKNDQSHIFDLLDNIPLIITKDTKYTLLHLAVKFSSENCLQKLVNLKVHKNTFHIPNALGEFPVHTACRNGNLNILQIIEKIVDFGVKDHNWNTPLHIACKEGHLKIVEFLINLNVKVDVRNKVNDTPFDLALNYGHFEIVQLILEKVPNLHGWKFSYSPTPLHLASEIGHLEFVEFLLKLSTQEATNNVNVTDLYGNTPLHLASRGGHHEIVKLLINSNSEVIVENKDNLTPLQMAVEKGHTEVTQMILEKYPDLITMKNSRGHTFLHLASENGHREMVEFLIKFSTQISNLNEFKNFTDIYGNTPLHTACQNCHYGVVHTLIKYGVDTTITNNDGRTALHKAYHSYHIVELLIEAGVKINATDNLGRTPLFTACMFGYEKTVETLIRYGADINIADKNNITPLQRANLRGQKSIITLLNLACTEKLADRFSLLKPS